MKGYRGGKLRPGPCPKAVRRRLVYAGLRYTTLMRGTCRTPAFLAFEEASEWFLRAGAAPGSGWHNRVTLRNCFGTEPPFDPGVCVSHIAPTPLLMVIASDDRLAPTAGALKAFERAGEPKRLELIEGDHFVAWARHSSSAAVAAASAPSSSRAAAPAEIRTTIPPGSLSVDTPCTLPL